MHFLCREVAYSKARAAFSAYKYALVVRWSALVFLDALIQSRVCVAFGGELSLDDCFL